MFDDVTETGVTAGYGEMTLPSQVLTVPWTYDPQANSDRALAVHTETSRYCQPWMERIRQARPVGSQPCFKPTLCPVVGC